MYEYGDLFSLSCTTPDFFGRAPEFAASQSLMATTPAKLVFNEYDSVSEALAVLKSEVGESSSSSSSYGSQSPLPSWHVQQPSLSQTSMRSSNLLHKNEFHHPIFTYLDESGFSNLQTSNRGLKNSLLHEKCNISVTNRVSRYSAEERKERIERYRSKRNQRNFKKKIMYECRKKLADSRTRIRGRFVRNEELNERSEAQWMGRNQDEDEDVVWINFLDAFSLNLIP